MSLPNIPDIAPNIGINRNDAYNLLLASIALEELGLAHVINAEAEKIQYILGTLGEQGPASPPSMKDLIELNKSVNQTLKTVIKNQMLLQFKLEDLIESPLPSISIKKYVSGDGGDTWHDANSPPGPSVDPEQKPMFKFVISNAGNVTLSEVSISDSVLGPISIGGLLPPGGYFEVLRTGEYLGGEQSNTATVIGYYAGQQVADSDIAYYCEPV